MIAIFVVAMLRVTTLKIRKLKVCQKLEFFQALLQNGLSFIVGQTKRMRFRWFWYKKVMFEEDSHLTMTEVEREAWMAFKGVVIKFLGNNKDPDYVTIVANTLETFKVLGRLISLKIHFLNSHLDFIPRKYWCSE
jgi:hypothetical protein